MSNCRQACPYNTLYGCKVKEKNAICPLTNSITPITEYRMTNGDRIRAMSNEKLVELMESVAVAGCPCPSRNCRASCSACIMDWLKEPAEEEE